ncbi:MAG: hypothetical protein FGM34_10885, partial [Solirubrobacteraceae bacterium]|nr:hypothetical protein [Solirubrobacteraceae bacterium]
MKISGSTALGDGGGVWADGPLNLTLCEVSGRTAGGKGGGVYFTTTSNQFSRINNLTTITTNTANSGTDATPGAGIYWEGTAADQFGCNVGVNPNSISGNTSASTKMDCAYGTTPT